MSIISNFKVCVRCMTYNHAPYIEDAMKGFSMQKTNFSFVCCIIDDASNDGEQEIINIYLKEHFDLDNNAIAKNEETDDYTMTFAQHKVNKHCYFAVFFLKYNHYQIKKSKELYFTRWALETNFVAMCEGDDFWISSDKLQKELDYLENHQEKALVYTNCNVFFHKEQILHKDVFDSGFFKPTYNYKDFLLEGKYLVPCSWMYKKNVKDSIDIPSFSTDGTLVIAFVLLIQNLVGYIDETTCTYRIVHGSASHCNNVEKKYAYLKGAFATEKYFLKHFNSYFTTEDILYLYNRRYQSLIKFALALGDKEMIREIKNNQLFNVSWKRRLLLHFPSNVFLRKLLYRIVEKSIQTGL